MKNLITTSILLFSFFGLFGQYNVQNQYQSFADELKTSSVKDVSFTSATFGSCQADKVNGLSDCTKSNLVDYLQDHITYPELARAYKIEDNCMVSFTIAKDGRSSEVVVRNCATNLFDSSVKKTIEKMSWQPVLKNGKPIDYKVSLNMKFTM